MFPSIMRCSLIRIRKLAALASFAAIAAFAPGVLLAQYNISTVAGGGPNNIPPLQSSIGFVGGVAIDSAGNHYFSDSYSSRVFKVASSGTVVVVAGNGTLGYSGDGGPATSAALNRPEGIAVDASGNLYIADTDNDVIREVVASTGDIQTVAGNAAAGAGYSGDGGLATSAQLNDPFGVFVDANGNIFIADTDNNVIREVVASSGDIQTVAGNATAGAGYAGDGAAATGAQLDLPQGVYLDAAGNIFIADTSNSVIREVTVANGNIQTVAGSQYQWSGTCNFSGDGGAATAAQLCLPTGLYVDSADNILLIADTQNFVVRVVNTSAQAVTIATIAIQPGNIQTVAGNNTYGYSGDGSLAISAQLNYPATVILDSSDDIFIADIFIADTDNFVVREVGPGGIIQAVAGNNSLSFSGDGNPATDAELNIPGSVALDATGNLYIADTYNSVIRVFNPGTQSVTINGIVIPAGDIQTVAGDGIACLDSSGGCGDGGAATSAELYQPQGVFVDASGNIFIADTGNSTIRVVNTGSVPLTIAGVTIQPATIQTIAGTAGVSGFAGDGGAPTLAQLANPFAVVTDAADNVFIADTENSAIRVINNGSQALTLAGVVIAPGDIATVAGTPPNACSDTSTGCGDNALATAAALNFPSGLSLDSADNIYIADTFNSAIRAVNTGTQAATIAGASIQPGDIFTVAGAIGQLGYSGDNGLPTAAVLNTPYGVTVDSLGNLFISDTDNNVIREVVNVALAIQTVAGSGPTSAGFSGDASSATSAMLNGPENVAVNGAGSVFIADAENSRIRQLVSTVVVAIVPSSATIPAGSSQQFLATVTGASNTAVTWQVNGVTGGNTTVGTISSAGLYQAPATVPASAITVTAISDANGTTLSTASVTIAASGAPGLAVSTNPAGVTVVYTSTTQAFIATVSGESNTAVTWQVNGTAGGNSTVGTIDDSGNYTAPATVPSPALVIITAVSQADATVTGLYPITIVTVPVASTPQPQTISPGGTATYSLALKANTGNPTQALTLSCLQSTLPPGATCTFTPPTITPGGSDVSFSLGVNVPSSSAAIIKNRGLWLATVLFGAWIPVIGVLLLAGTRRRRCSWLGLTLGMVSLATLVGCGSSSSSSSNPVDYTIQVQATSPSQPNPVEITTVQLRVQ